jgi:CDP-glucose 4,6-dehydratase
VEIVVKPESSFWKQRRVLITGHTGFKGAWLWQWLKMLGAQVSGFALPPDTEPNLFCLANIQSDVQSRFGDVRDSREIHALLQNCRPDVVFHLAAQPLVRRSYEDPITTIETNVLGTTYLLDAIRFAPTVRCALIVTSDKVYRAASADPHRECDELGGQDPYSASKACAEIVIEAWRKSFFAASGSGTGIASARAGNVIGGGDWSADRLIPDCVRAFQKAGVPVTIRNAAAIRPWQHVLDALCGYLTLAERLFQDPPRFSEAWNFGPAQDQSRTVLSVVRQLAEQWGGGCWILAEDASLPERSALCIDSSKARERLGWVPRLSLEDSIAWTVEWYQKQLQGESAANLCVEQIRRFEGQRGIPA